ncbi:MAG: VanZ family protein [Solirubrobacteraceae bacterium]
MIKYLFYASLFIILIVTQTPIKKPIIDISYFDKVEHFLSFFYLTIIGFLSYNNKKIRILLFLLFYGFLIELLQATLPFNRQFDLLDLLANCFGIISGYFVYKKKIKTIVF